MSLPDPEVVKMNIASSITVTAISSNDNCIMSPISLDHLFPHSDKNISIPRPLLKFFSSFFSALSLYPPSLFQLSEPGISFWLNDFFCAVGTLPWRLRFPDPLPSARARNGWLWTGASSPPLRASLSSRWADVWQVHTGSLHLFLSFSSALIFSLHALHGILERNVPGSVRDLWHNV